MEQKIDLANLKTCPTASFESISFFHITDSALKLGHTLVAYFVLARATVTAMLNTPPASQQ